MPILPYDDEEKRRRRMLTPGILPPEIAAPSPMPVPTRGTPGILAGPEPPPVELSRPSRSVQYEAEKEGYMRGTPGRAKSAAKGALGAFLGGGGLVGAAMGALGGAVDPKGMREQEFNQRIRPKILEGFEMEDRDRSAQMAAEDRQLNNAYRTAQIGELNRRGLPETPRPRAPVRSDRGLYDLDAGKILPGTEPLPAKITPYWVETDKGYVDLNAPGAQPSKVQKLQKPRSSGGGGSRGGRKYIGISDIEKAVEASGGKMSMDQVAAKFREKGYMIDKTR